MIWVRGIRRGNVRVGFGSMNDSSEGMDGMGETAPNKAGFSWPFCGLSVEKCDGVNVARGCPGENGQPIRRSLLG